MDHEERSFEFTAYVEPAQLGEYLESLAKYVRSGRLHLTAGADAIDLDLAPNVKLELAAKVRPQKGKGSLQLDISWKQPPQFEEGLKIEPGEEMAAEASPKKGKGGMSAAVEHEFQTS
jgi:amphi-Trp domain-containing protein